ncbi:hypothetical protein [Aestuariimicrobium sp. T2.26MG-19.2B]|uniref:hypothetical protein n=1 Tax=Aestuariimicrobium sp. T2.26MG-19.2B TaxID=3040679 RepID=UPI0024776194|nr:hypothetical protein [Aestuariimicrobium sp. T2.26MG-19.2B]CAI9408791.1 hypothetical protein AESSP_02098 [Aestuariimicrobium sp. T2.26MG-19.2B]
MSTTVFRHDWAKVEQGLDWEPRREPRARSGERRKPIRDEDRMFVPPGWPESVLPACEPDWEQSAAAFLLDCCPHEYRGYPLLRRQPVVLARLAAQYVESQVRATREGLMQARAGLQEYVDTPVLDGTVELLQTEEARLVRLRRAVMLVEETLRGKIFVSRL